MSSEGDHVADTRQRRAPVRWGTLAACLAVVGVASLVAFLLFVPGPTFNTVGPVQLPRDWGYIVSTESLLALGYEWEEVPVESNAAWDIIDAANAMTRSTGQERRFNGFISGREFVECPSKDAAKAARRGQWPPGDPAVVQWMTDHSAALEFLRLAATKPDFQFPVIAWVETGEWQCFHVGLFVGIGQYLTLGDLALLTAARDMAAGNSDQAISHFRSVLSFAAHLTGNGREPERHSLEATPGMVLWGWGLEALQATIQSRRLDLRQLKQLRLMLTSFRSRSPRFENLLEAWKRDLLREMADEEFAFGTPRGQPWKRAKSLWHGLWATASNIGTRPRLDRVFDMARKLPQMSAQEALSDSVQTSLKEAVGRLGLTPQLSRYYRACVATRTRIDLLRLASACLEFYETEKRFPADLAEIGVADWSPPPRNHFTDGDFIYHATAHELTIRASDTPLRNGVPDPSAQLCFKVTRPIPGPR